MSNVLLIGEVAYRGSPLRQLNEYLASKGHGITTLVPGLDSPENVIGKTFYTIFADAPHIEIAQYVKGSGRTPIIAVLPHYDRKHEQRLLSSGALDILVTDGHEPDQLGKLIDRALKIIEPVPRGRHLLSRNSVPLPQWYPKPSYASGK